MKDYLSRVRETGLFLKNKINSKPEIGILTGTGLSESVGAIRVEHEIDYRQIPDFPVSTVESHAGKMVFGSMGGKQLMVCKGRFHLYEGYSPHEVTYPVRVMQELGVKVLILTNAAGGLNLDYSKGDIMIIRDHINLTCANPLIGPNEDTWGDRFPDMTNAYDQELAHLAEQVGSENNLDLKSGVYAGLKGPSLETSAETRFLRIIGADAIGFSTIQETIAAVHAGIKVLGLSTITNINDPDNPTPDSVEEIIETANQAAPKLELIIKNVVEKINE